MTVNKARDSAMGMIHKQRLIGPSVWKGPDFAGDKSWIRPLNARQCEELLGAVAAVQNAGKRFPDFGVIDFPLAELGRQLREWGNELESGHGFILLRGLPIDGLDDDAIDILYFGLGLHMGVPVRQNPAGDLIGRVMNVGDLEDRQTRVYETNAYLPYHTDPSDMVGLLCIRAAKSGGVSSLISSGSLYNEMLLRYPEYLSVFYRPMYYPHLGGDEPALAPVFSYHQGKMSVRYLRQYLELGADTMGRPLSAVEHEAMDVFDKIMHEPEMRIDMMMQPGDLQLVNNYSVMHSRTSFEDHDDAHLRRRKLRLWLKLPGARQLAYPFEGRHGFPDPA